MIYRNMALALSLGIAGAGQAYAQNVEQKPIEVIHSYVSASDSAALSVFHDRFVQEGGEWIDGAVARGAEARAIVVRRVLGGDPPGAGLNVTKTVYAELLEGGFLQDITEVAEEENWQAVLPSGLWDSINHEGRVVAVPIQIQSQNFLYSNAAILADVGAEHPANYEEFFAVLEAVKQARPDVIPFVTTGNAVDTRQFFLGTVAAVAGVDVYNAIYVDHDIDAVRSDEFRAAVEAFRRLGDYVDPNWAVRDWNEAVDLLATGRAAFQILGDWGKGALTHGGLTPGQDFGCSFLDDKAIASGNVFIFPKSNDAGVTTAQLHLARVMLAQDLQVPFALNKGTIPVRIDVDTSELDICAQYAAEVQASAETSVFGDHYSISPQGVGDLTDLIQTYWSSSSLTTDDFVDRFARIIAQE